MKYFLIFLFATFTVTFSTTTAASFIDCIYRRPNVFECKLCRDTPGVGFTYFMQGGQCYGCQSHCTQITPSPVALVKNTESAQADYFAFTPGELRGAIEASGGSVCAVGAVEAEPTNFYALRINREIVERLATFSPKAAQVLVALREAPVVPPLRVHNGESFSELLPTVTSVLNTFDRPEDESAIRTLMIPLRSNQSSVTLIDVEFLANGRILLEISARVTNERKETIGADQPIAIELRAIPGASSKVSGYEKHIAQVYEIVSFGLRDDY